MKGKVDYEKAWELLEQIVEGQIEKEYEFTKLKYIWFANRMTEIRKQCTEPQKKKREGR